MRVVSLFNLINLILTEFALFAKNCVLNTHDKYVCIPLGCVLVNYVAAIDIIKFE